jgi:type 1 fimbria pilin
MKKSVVLVMLGVLLLCVGQSVKANCADFVEADLTYEVGNLYMPQDARVGSTIGIRKYTRSRWINCSVLVPFTFAGHIYGAKVPSTPTAVGAGTVDNLYATSIPGVSVVVDYTSGPSYFCNTGTGAVFPVTFESCGSGATFAEVAVTLYLIKTGVIPAGTHDFNGLQIYGIEFDFGSGPERWVTGVLNGSVTVAGCSLPQEVGNNIDVPMGTWERRTFDGPGTFTATQNFVITLSNCVAGTYPTGQAWNFFASNYANIRLEGVRGSTIIDAPKGILSLNEDSDAAGVAVQVLKMDGSPLPLGVDTPLMLVQDGVTSLQLGARYIQTAGSSIGPQPGVANATANFTITYK